MIKYDMLSERIDIDIKGNIYVQKLPGDDRVGLLCPYAKNQFAVCNVRCAKCSVELKCTEMDENADLMDVYRSYWEVTCCGTTHRAQLLYQQHHAGSMELQYHEVTKQYN